MIEAVVVFCQHPRMHPITAFLFLVLSLHAAEPEFPLTADSKPQAEVLKGTMLKDAYTAKEGSVFPGTQRDYQIYLPASFDKTQPAAFMVFQDGVIYQAPVVFDNLIAQKDIPPLVGIFIKPGVVPAANDNALPRFNRSYEYDSITPTYSQFLIDEFLPAIEAKHGLKLSTDPNHAAISGNSSGGICAFMVAWHRPDRFRRVFTGVGTYVGIHGADQLPVLVRKFEPKPLRVFLQSGTGDNNLYCGDWWMANQMMERSLTWAGYDVNHAWGEGGHNQKHASQIFPDVLRWLWRDWQTNIEVKANPKGESKWRGYEVVGEGEWMEYKSDAKHPRWEHLCPNSDGDVLAWSSGASPWEFGLFPQSWKSSFLKPPLADVRAATWTKDNVLILLNGEADKSNGHLELFKFYPDGSLKKWAHGIGGYPDNMVTTFDGRLYCSDHSWLACVKPDGDVIDAAGETDVHLSQFALSPDQTQLYAVSSADGSIGCRPLLPDGTVGREQSRFYKLEGQSRAFGLCVDTNGWLYVATSLGVQVCDQAGRVNFIIPTPKQPYDVCFGDKDLSELFIACGDAIYKRPTKAKGVVSGQQAPIKPPPPKL